MFKNLKQNKKMKSLKLLILPLLGAILLITSCNDETDNMDDTSPDANATPLSAFDEFNAAAVSISFDGDNITIESNALPNHTSPYWESTNPLYIEQIVGDHTTPGFINSRSLTLTVSSSPEKATTSSATGLGAIGISVTGVPIYNGQEGPNIALDLQTSTGFDYAGGHNGPGGYHYHIESSDIDENTTLSYDDEELNGIMADGFLLYGRKCNSTAGYPTALDSSGGHTSATQHSEGETFYHYHIINEYTFASAILLFGNDLQGTPNTIL